MRENNGFEPASDADMLRHLMEAKGVNQAELHQATGIPKSTISEILAGKKQFSRQITELGGVFWGRCGGVGAESIKRAA